MAATFIAAVHERHDSYIIDSTVTVYQQVTADSYVPVANIHDSSDPVDHRHTRIDFAEGTLIFEAAYDGLLLNRFVWTFLDGKRSTTGMTLHNFLSTQRACLYPTGPGEPSACPTVNRSRKARRFSIVFS